MNQRPIVVWADDLTGAANAISPFSQEGFQTRIVTLDDAFVEQVSSENIDVVCIDTNARELPVDGLPSLPRPNLVKIDSLGRGDIRGLVTEICHRYSFDYVHIDPAWPAANRLITSGIGVNGFNWLSLRNQIADTLPDIEVHLGNTLNATKYFDENVLYIGAQGMFSVLSGFLKQEGYFKDRADFQKELISGALTARTVSVFGSLHSVALRQRDRLARESSWSEIKINSEMSLAAFADSVSQLRNSDCVVCSVEANSPEEWDRLFHKHALAIQKLLENAGQISTTGGATSARILRVLGQTRLEMTAENDRGQSISYLSDGRRFVTQPGSIGDEDDYLKIHEDFLTRIGK